MTALLYAKDHFKDVLLEGRVPRIDLMFDEDNPTCEEEILGQ